MASQWPNGSFGGDPHIRVSYPHLMCHLALAMAYEKSKQASDHSCPESSSSFGCQVEIAALKTSVELASAWTAAGEHPYPYGWRYHFFGDVSHHAWGVAALAISARAGTNVPPTALAHAKIFLDSPDISLMPVTDNGVTVSSTYRYQVGAEGSVKQWTNMGLVSQLYLGVSSNHAAVQQFLTAHPLPDVIDNQYSSYWPLYGNVHGTHLRYLAGGAQWQTWDQALRAQLLAMQSQAGHSKGSFEIPAGRGEQSYGGRHTVTVFSLLCLEPNFAGFK